MTKNLNESTESDGDRDNREFALAAGVLLGAHFLISGAMAVPPVRYKIHEILDGNPTKMVLVEKPDKPVTTNPILLTPLLRERVISSGEKGEGDIFEAPSKQTHSSGASIEIENQYTFPSQPPETE